ncbi:hypothetical protein MAPG_07789 [Magnaporthiopsis poae ATCC 64411]|uniref:Uncharacterized protein n=1 Tax=Magnaporthiopsis poae (strain ATCC 64411 / 73-15) TaxID=644358 RepID=A0A0C4E5L7_MAGP6|nr:hypothetical protein MAPG_07789 [Magnaporthiopsis poae ATCC 64411]
MVATYIPSSSNVIKLRIHGAGGVRERRARGDAGISAHVLSPGSGKNACELPASGAAWLFFFFSFLVPPFSVHEPGCIWFWNQPLRHPWLSGIQSLLEEVGG